MCTLIGHASSAFHSCRSKPYPKVIGGDGDETLITCITSPQEDLESVIYFGGYSSDLVITDGTDGIVPKAFMGVIHEDAYAFKNLFLANTLGTSTVEGCDSSQVLDYNYALFGMIETDSQDFLLG